MTPNCILHLHVYSLHCNTADFITRNHERGLTFTESIMPVESQLHVFCLQNEIVDMRPNFRCCCDSTSHTLPRHQQDPWEHTGRAAKSRFQERLFLRLRTPRCPAWSFPHRPPGHPAALQGHRRDLWFTHLPGLRFTANSPERALCCWERTRAQVTQAKADTELCS